MAHFETATKSGASANYAPDSLGELEGHLQQATRRARRRDHIGLGYISHAGLLDPAEYVELCKDQ